MKKGYKEIMEGMRTAKRGKEMRKIHRELKAYGSGIPMYDRYPNLPLIVSIISLLLVITKPGLLCILQWLQR